MNTGTQTNSMNAIRTIVCTYVSTGVSWAWIDPKGKIYEIPRHTDTHSQWAKDWLEKRGKYIERGHTYALVDMGWVAATNQFNYLVPDKNLKGPILDAILDIIMSTAVSEKMNMEDMLDPNKVFIEWSTNGGKDFDYKRYSIDEFISIYGGKRMLNDMYKSLIYRK